MIQCSICAVTFTLRKNLNQHMRKKHNIDPPILGGKITCPMLCVDKFRTHKDLRSHLESFHEFTIEKEEHVFPDIEAFETWKKRFEMTSGYAYICRISEKKLNKGAMKKHFICHRSGVFKSESTGQKQLKKMGSNKIGNTCPSIMEVSRSLSDGTVHLLFWKTHIGHDPDLKRTPTPRKVHPKKSDTITYEVCAILPAAGIGERMGIDTPKQYIPIHEKPVICYTVDAFIRIPFIKKVVVVAASQDLDFMLQTLSQQCALKDEKLMVTEGCGTRHQSIEAGIKALQTCCEIQPEVVVIHDGVRPFFSEEIVCNVILAAKEFGAAGVVCPLVSTVISLDENSFLDSSLDRNKFKASEMPQAFQFNIISTAYAMSTAHDLEHGTECLHLVQKYCNVKAKLLPGTTNLWKITHRKDIYTAAASVKENQSVAIVNPQLSDNLVSHLQTSLCKKFDSVVTIGKLNDSSFNKFSNIVQLWKNKSISTVLDELENDYSVPKSTELLSIVYVTLDNFDEKLNFIEMQKRAKTLAKELRAARCLFFFIFLPKDSPFDIIQDAAGLVTSLLFNCDPHISGSIFLL